MALNYQSRHIYNIDYNQLYAYSNQTIIFRTPELQHQYLSNWMRALQEQDMNFTNSLADQCELNRINEDIRKYSQIFTMPIDFPFQSVYLNFRIAHILEDLSSSELATTNLKSMAVSRFTKSNSEIFWTPTTDTLPHPLSQDPVILIEMILGINMQYKWLVIDGNHRLTAAVASKEKKIPSLLFNSPETYNNNFFLSSFDALLYVFLNEFAAMTLLVRNTNIPEKLAFNMSFLNSNNVMTIPK